jgi:hypothetical protein
MPSFVISGRDSMPHRCQAHLAAIEGCRVYAIYGPPEVCFLATMDEVGAASGTPSGLTNHAILVLGSQGQPVPLGAIGEVHIGGASSARGYYGHAEVTEAHFVLTPLPNGETLRLFRTGQLGRRRDDGRLEFLGPKEGILHFRGLRIRRTSVEAVLRNCPGISEVILTVADCGTPNCRLVACVVPDGRAPTLRQLQTFLRTQLPGCVAPTQLVVVDSMIRTEGTADLAPPPNVEERLQWEDHGEWSPGPLPSDAAMVASAWAGLLGVEEVSLARSYWGSFTFLHALELALAAGASITLEQVRRHRTLGTLADELAFKSHDAQYPHWCT